MVVGGKDSKEFATHMSTSLNSTCRGLIKDILYFASNMMLTAELQQALHGE